MEKININEIKSNPKNPRTIKGDKFKKLVQSIKEFPQMLQKRPLVIDENNVVLGGNMRLKALQELGYTEVPVIRANDRTQEEKDQFIIKDNVGYGEWDRDDLETNWDTEKLEDWGLDIKSFEIIEAPQNAYDDFTQHKEDYQPQEGIKELKINLIDDDFVDFVGKLDEIMERLKLESYSETLLLLVRDYYARNNS